MEERKMIEKLNDDCNEELFLEIKFNVGLLKLK
jgi:hypothetical protein